MLRGGESQKTKSGSIFVPAGTRPNQPECALLHRVTSVLKNSPGGPPEGAGSVLASVGRPFSFTRRIARRIVLRAASSQQTAGPLPRPDRIASLRTNAGVAVKLRTALSRSLQVDLT